MCIQELATAAVMHKAIIFSSDPCHGHHFIIIEAVDTQPPDPQPHDVFQASSLCPGQASPSLRFCQFNNFQSPFSFALTAHRYLLISQTRRLA